MRASLPLQLVTAWALFMTPGWAGQPSQKTLLSSVGKESPLDESFKNLVEKQLEEWKVPGLAVAVVDGDDTWAEGYGMATFPSNPVTPSTLFYAGSTTKAFTAGLVSLLIDSGNFSNFMSGPLGWRTPISDIIPEDFVLMDEWATKHLTLEDAMSHRTGFPRHDKALAQVYGPDRHVATPRDFTRGLRYLPMVTEPRTTWRYCNLMFTVVSHTIQTLTGTWLGTLFQHHIWQPLNMTTTYLSLEDAMNGPEHVASGYYWDEKESEYKFVPYMSLKSVTGEGGIVSNVIDYSKWLRSLMTESPPLSKAGHEAVKTPRIPVGNDKRGYDGPMMYALGWDLGTYKGHRVFTHSGGMEAYGAEVFFLPDVGEKGFGIVTLGNTAVTSNIVGEILVWHLINNKLGVDESERFDWAAGWKETIKLATGLFTAAVDILYPNRAETPMPKSLPLEEYLGTYWHPAYQNLTLELLHDEDMVVNVSSAVPEIRAAHKDFLWQMYFDFAHVSGEYWIMYITGINNPTAALNQIATVEFKLGVDGKVQGVQVEYMENGPEGKILYEKIE